MTISRLALRDHGIPTIIAAAALLASSWCPLHAGATLIVSPDGTTVYDTANKVNWLANADLPATNRFGLPVCTASGTQPCINPSGSMNYTSAAAWVQAMNAANYLGHNNWQLPTTPLTDSNCGKTGPNGASFGFGCTAGALASLYNALGFKSPDTAVPVPNNTVGPFSNLQPHLYWSASNGATASSGNATFSFATGWQGANTLPNFLYLLPMIPGKMLGAPPATGTGLQVNPGGQTVYDPMTNITWVANANLAATNPFGLPLCTTPTSPALCVAQDGAMAWASAGQFLANMNSAAYLGQTSWEAPAIDTSCPGYNCGGDKNPMGNLFYDQLGFTQGMSAVAPSNIAVGPFHNLQPYLYWSCVAAAIQDACEAAGPADNFEESYSFGSGFQGTDLLANDLYVTAYYVGPASTATSPAIFGAENAAGGSATIAPNTWVEIDGTNLAPAGDTRVWQVSDFVGSDMPTQLDGVSVTVNGTPAYIYYISPTQVNVLTPPGAMPASVAIELTNNGAVSAPVNIPAAPLSPSFFAFNGGPYVAAEHANYSLLGPATLYLGLTTPAVPGETVLLYANGFGATSVPVVSGSSTQSGALSPLPVVEIGGIAATVKFAGLVAPGEFQFNVVIPANAPSGDNTLTATYNGVTTSPVTLITIRGSAPATSATYYVAPYGNNSWSGTLAAPNPANTDGPFATFDGARSAIRAPNKTGLSQVTVQFRGGSYFLPTTEMFTAADSGSAATQIVYQNYPGESHVISGGMRVQNWTNVTGNTWQTTLPASTQYFENLFYNGVRRLRPRLGGSLGTYYRIAATVYLNAQAPNCTVNVPSSGWECFDRFQYNPTDPIANTWKNLAPTANNPCNQPAGNQALAGDVEVLDFEQFSTSKLRISCIDTTNYIVYLTGATPSSQNNASETGFIAGNRYLVDNVQDALTQPGQWFLDRSATPWTLTYLANPGENPNTNTVIVPQLPQVLVASNLQYVTFQGLTFEHDNYTIPPAGHQSVELEPDISAAVSFQNSQHITFDSGTVTQTSGTGLELIPCINGSSPAYCVSTSSNAVVADNLVENSAFYDIGVLGIRIGNPFQPADTDANVPKSTTVQNNVVEGYGRTIPAAFGIAQGMGHDNLYTHNEVYDGYHCAISTSQGIGESTVPSGIGNANTTISFNHVYNLLQGIMNDGGSIRIDGGNSVFTAAGNKILNNRIHDVTDASALDSNGYGGDGIYLDNNTGLVDVENNLVYRVSGNAVYTPHGPPAPNEANTVKNNILAYARLAMASVNFPYGNGVPATIPQVFDMTNNLFYFDRSNVSTPKFWVQGGCLYAGGALFTQFQEWNSNMYWRTDGAFASAAKTFAVQPSPGTGPDAPCSGNLNAYAFYTFSGWQQTVGEDLQSVVQNPGFNNPAYPTDDYSLPNGSPGVGFVVFDPGQAGRSNPVINPPAVPATFPTMLFNAATDF